MARRHSEPEVSNLIQAYSELAILWRKKADAAMESRDPYEVYHCIKQSIAADAKARQLTQRHTWVDFRQES